MTARPPASVRRSRTFFPLLGALAYAGGVVAYVPLLTLFLPLRVEQVAGAARFDVLAATMMAGAVMAGASGIVFGWLSDRSLERGGGRRRWILGGLVALFLSYAGVAGARTPWAIVAAVMAFQVALNAVLGPLVALLAEESADRQKGLMSGLLAGAQPFAAAIGPVLVAWTVPGLGIRLAAIAGVVAVCLVPLMLAPSMPVERAPERAVTVPRRDLAIALGARLLMQIAGNVLFAYLLFFMEEFVGPAARASVPLRVGGLLFLANFAPLPVAVLLGRWSDRIGRRKPFLIGASALAAVGLAVMGCADGWTGAATGFCLYSVGSGVFLTLQIGFAMQLLPDPRRRGRDLGIVNLSNTAPVLIGPVLIWWLATPRHLSPLLLTLAALSLAGGLAMLGVKGRR